MLNSTNDHASLNGGYKTTKIGTVPSSWDVVKLDELADPSAPIRYGVVQIGPDTPGGVPIVPIKHIRRIGDAALHHASPEIEAPYAGSRVKGGDVLLSVKGTIGEVGVVPAGFEGNIAREIARIRPKSEYDAEFLALQLEADHTQRRIKSKIVGSTRLEFSIHAVRDFLIALPQAREEQRKIAEILRSWDGAIETTERLIAAKERRVSAVRLRYFEGLLRQEDRTAPARAIFETVSEKNRPDLPLLAVLQDLGVVRRDQLERRVVMPDGGEDAYKVVRPGDFVISLRSFQGGLELSEIEGLVSPAYTVLRPTINIVSAFYRHFFKSSSFIGRLDRLIFGIRDGKQIAFRDFGDMKIPAPSSEMQQQISVELDLAERDQRLTLNLLEKYKVQKRGLMQKLLTGEWRVPLRDSEVEDLAKRAARGQAA